jgi:hypothetical protein
MADRSEIMEIIDLRIRPWNDSGVARGKGFTGNCAVYLGYSWSWRNTRVASEYSNVSKIGQEPESLSHVSDGVPRMQPVQTAFLFVLFGTCLAAQTVDTLIMGDDVSEQNHGLTATFPPLVAAKDDKAPPASDPSAGPPSDVIKGGKGEPARRLLPRTPNPDMYGAELDFTMKVDPLNQNYFTVKLWGSDSCPDGAIILDCEGFEIGKRHGNSSADLFVNRGGSWLTNRFWYRTVYLPLKLTKGKQSVAIKLRSAGMIYDYANQPGKSYIPDYQHLMKTPSWPIYRVYTHVGGFIDTASEVQGDAVNPPTRISPGPESMDEWKRAVSEKAGNLLFSSRPPGLNDVEYLANCYEVSWTPAFHSPDAISQVIKGIDEAVKTYSAKATDVAAHGNDSWGGPYGPLGVAIYKLYPEMKDRMAETIDFGGTLGLIARKDAWSKALRASIDFGRYNRRSISSQEIACADHIYEAKRGLELVDPDNALSEPEALRYPYEACGLSPYLGDDQPGKGSLPVRGADEPGNKHWYGPNWYMVTTKGTTKEPSFVGSDYGEMGPFVYDVGRLANDRKLMDQGLLMIRARAHFRFPSIDSDGFQIMTATEPIGARNNFLPGHNAYIDRDSGADIVAHENAPDLDGYFQEELSEGQLYAMAANGASATNPGAPAINRQAGSTDAPYLPDDMAAALAHPKSNIRLPEAVGAPDFAWGDEENMVVAAKHGEERFFTNMVWRGNTSINGTAMIFLVTPLIAVRAEVQLDDVRYVPTGQYETIDGAVDSFASKQPPDNKLYPNADMGAHFPIAVRPDLKDSGAPAKNNDGGRGTGYTLCYGNWLIGINGNYTTGDYTMKLPAGFTSGTDLVSGKGIKAPVVIPKGTTVVFYLSQPSTIPTSPWTTSEPIADVSDARP